MARQKVKMAYIENETTRKSTFKKRKGGLLKKANELATLCDVPIGVIVESPLESDLEVWPSREAMNNIVSEWNNMSAMDKTKKMLNQETFLEQRITKATESWKKLRRENKEMEMKEFMFNCLSGKTSVSCIDKNDLGEFRCVIDQYLKDLNRRNEFLKKNDESSSSAAAAGTTTSHVMPLVEMGSSSVGFYDKIQNRTDNNLEMKQINMSLDLNLKQW